jgi:bifunctional non-homologous end joining protein LigD
MPSFVVHEHHSRRLHFDFRLEMGGVLRSWAVPKGPSLSTKQRRLAILVEDHPLEYKDFEGIIPKGFYGAGPVVIWDRGNYRLIRGSLEEGNLEFFLEGRKLKGLFVLTRLKGKEREWLLMKKKDEHAREDFKTEPDLTEERLRMLREVELPCEFE